MKPLTLLIKPAAGLCNMDCRYCFYKAASKDRENRVMSAETVDALIQKIKAYQPSALSVLFQGGEPTLARLGFFRYFIGRVQENLSVPVQYALQTNGLLLDKDYAAFFKTYGFLIGVSLDGDRKTNDRYRRDKNGGGVLPRVLEAVSLLRRYGVAFNILSVVDDENARDLENTWQFFKRQGFEYLQFIPYVDEGGGVSLSEEAYETFLKQSFDLWYADCMRGKYVSVRHIDNYIGILLGRPPENCAMCGICGSYFVVEANGDLYPCDFYCKEPYRLGSIFDADPFSVGEAQRRFIAASETIHGHCRACEYYALCRGGCRRDRTERDTKNRWCRVYRNFFAYAGERMLRAADLFAGR